MKQVYLRPIAFADSPQSEEGAAVRLAGGLTYASRFAVIVREDGRIVSRTPIAADGVAKALAELPDDLAAPGEAQWANLRLAHPPLQCGTRTIRLDQPQIMGILNVTPDSFSDGGKFLDNPEEEIGRAHV